MPAARRRTTTRRTTRKRTSAAPKPVEAVPTLSPGERIWLLDVPFEERGIANANGARWHSGLRATIYVGRQLPHGLTPYASQPFSWERWLEDDLNDTPGATPSAAHTLTPRPHQQEAANAILRSAKIGARGFLLADEVGLGKTISALEGVLALRHVRTVENLLIVCPLAVVPHWRRTVADLGLADEGIRVVVINYDRLKKLVEVPESAMAAKRTRTKNKRIAKDGTSIVDWDVVIADESHKLKNFSTAQRAQLFARIASYSSPREEAPFVLYCSATAGQTPTELGYLAPLLSQVTKSPASSLKDYGGWLEQQGFHVQHESRFDRWVWTDDPTLRERDITRMRSFLFERKTPVAMRRLPTDIAGWPEITRILLPVDLTSEQQRLYDEAWTSFRREMKLALRGNDPKAGMVARLRFRQKASLLRVDGTVDHVLDLLDNGLQVAVSCQFLESLDAIKEQLEKAKIHVSVMDGRDPTGREAARLAFQRGETTVCLFTPVEGFSLHQGEVLADGTQATDAPRAMVVHDPRYSGIESIQIEGRTHRDGKAANVYYVYGEGTVEEDVLRTLLARVESTKALVGDDTETIKALEAVLLKDA